MSPRAPYTQRAPKIIQIMSLEGSREGAGGDHPLNRAISKVLNKEPIDHNRLSLLGMQYTIHIDISC